MSKNSELFGTSAVMLSRKSPVSWSFNRESRFKRKNYSVDVDYLPMPSTLNQRTTTMGLGSRWSPRNVKGKDSPPPGLYSIPSSLSTKGTIFSRNSSLPPITPAKIITPGPGSYNFHSNIGKESPKYSFKGNNIKILVPQTPAPGCYTPKNTLTVNGGYKNISFGIGTRKLSLGRHDNPGPGSYNLQSDFEKIKMRSYHY